MTVLLLETVNFLLKYSVQAEVARQADGDGIGILSHIGQAEVGGEGTGGG